MAQIREKSPYAGQTVKTKSTAVPTSNGLSLAGKDFTIEDWWENVYGRSWMFSTGNPAALEYAFRCGNSMLPIDNNVLYGKIDGFGYLIHLSELCLPEVS